MASVTYFSRDEINKSNPIFSQIRTTIETVFYGNNVVKINSLKEAYKLAKNSPGTIVTDMPVYKPEEIGLDEDAKILLFNDGAVVGRCAAARRIVGEADVDTSYYAEVIRDAAYKTRFRKLYHAQAYVGLHEDFMVKAHLLIPEGHENILYNWLLNFQYINEKYIKMYENSKVFEKEGDIYIFSDPDWKDEDHPLGLALFDPEHNCAAILGMKYFGEHKKGTLTLAWGIANRNGFAACHGGLKRYNLKDGRKYTIGVFGLSGSGKSTITHEKHGGKYDITILHDDAYVISTEDKSSIALEPSYFDKTQDYPLTSEANKYLITVQNCGATLDQDGKIVIVIEDLRNGNGRAIKSKLWADNRVDKIEESVDAIIWLMKDTSLPPVLKINDPILAATMGATLATKRTSAERLVEGIDRERLVIEPYANPFRTYPLKDDYYKFKELFEKGKVECYIFNTGFFIDKKIPKEVTLNSLEKIVNGEADFRPLGNIKAVQYLPIEGFEINMDEKYIERFYRSIDYRIEFLEKLKKEKAGRDRLPEEALDCLYNIKDELVLKRNKRVV
ncbi:MAG: phosphoenolpyruvate carboxykinase (ATP) [Tissierellia bacterium]|nr:phosphoenolpyruvate carboxykinase (ATP) [Tissierellia bacterium]